MNTTITLSLVIVLLVIVCVYFTRNEQYEFVIGKTSLGHEVPIEFSPVERDWLGRYKIPPPKWFREQCNKYGSSPPYKGAVGCEDSMLDQRWNGSCNVFYCNK